MQVELLTIRLKVQGFLAREDGQDLVEYALLVGMLAVGAVAVLNSTATQVITLFSNVVSNLNSA